MPTDSLSAHFLSAGPSFVEPSECGCYEGCEFVAPAVTLQECNNCPPSRRVLGVNCQRSDGACKKVIHLERHCHVIEGDDNFWTACPRENDFPCTQSTPTPMPTPTPTPTPVPCPLTDPSNCPSGKPVDPCTHNVDVPGAFQNGCPIFWEPSTNGLCCVPHCDAQPSPE